MTDGGFPAWSSFICKMGIMLPTSWGCGEHQLRLFKGSEDFKKLCKNKVSQVHSLPQGLLCRLK